MKKPKIKLPEEIVLKLSAHLEITQCTPDWGGTYAWGNRGKKFRVCGFKTEMDARRHAVADAIGDNDVVNTLIKEFNKLYNAKNRKKKPKLETG